MRTILLVAIIALGLVGNLAAEPPVPVAYSTNDDSEVTRRIEAALTKKVTIAPFQEWRLDEVAAELSKLFDIPIVFDMRALADANIQGDTLVAMTVTGISLRTYLRWLLEPIELDWQCKNGTLQISTQSALNDLTRNGITKVYPIADIAFPPGGEVRESSQLQTSFIQYGYWAPGKDVSTRVFAAPDGKSPQFVVSAPERAHELIASHLNAIRRARKLQFDGDTAKINRPEDLRSIGLADNELVGKLAARIESPPKQQISLSEFAKLVESWIHVPVMVDRRSLLDAGMQDVKLDWDGHPSSLRHALNRTLDPIEMTWLVEQELLVITTKAAADDFARYGETRVYPVWDLVAGVEHIPGKYERTDFLSLPELIQDMIAPTAWGDGKSFDQYPGSAENGTISIMQTRHNHEAIDAMLLALRRSREVQKGEQGKPQSAPLDPNALVIRAYDLRYMNAFLCGSSGGHSGLTDADDFKKAQLAAEMIKVIPQFIQPDSWQEQRGVKIRSAGSRIIIEQTENVHGEVRKFLLHVLAPDTHPAPPSSQNNPPAHKASQD